jgi:hypothetical protein
MALCNKPFKNEPLLALQTCRGWYGRTKLQNYHFHMFQALGRNPPPVNELLGLQKPTFVIVPAMILSLEESRVCLL